MKFFPLTRVLLVHSGYLTTVNGGDPELAVMEAEIEHIMDVPQGTGELIEAQYTAFSLN